MTGRDYYEWGDWNAVCSMCGRKRKASELVKNWQGQWRCPEHNEGRHPQEFVRPRASEKPPPFVQPPADVYITNFCTTRSCVTGTAIAECAVADYVPEA